MQIAQMRSSLEADFSQSAKFGEQFPAMPDWAVRRIFEKRNRLTLTPLPREVEARTVRSVMATARRNAPAVAVATDEVPSEEFERLKRRLAYFKVI